MKNNYTIDWHAQWADHGWNFRDGFVRIDFASLQIFSSIKPEILLAPGPGFGDFSHPTTRLVLSLMSQHVKDKAILDVGCGSGVLSIAAIALGAKKAYGIDIDENALVHAQENSRWNDFQNNCHFGPISDCFPNPELIVMNMIRSEQEMAWQSLPKSIQKCKSWITSGVLVEEEEHYLTEGKKRGWNCLERHSEDGWLVFRWQ